MADFFYRVVVLLNSIVTFVSNERDPVVWKNSKLIACHHIPVTLEVFQIFLRIIWKHWYSHFADITPSSGQGSSGKRFGLLYEKNCGI